VTAHLEDGTIGGGEVELAMVAQLFLYPDGVDHSPRWWPRPWPRDVRVR